MWTAEQHIIVVDLGFGDAGKGATVDWLCANDPGIGAVVRFNGGAQAAHNVVAEGRHHTFSQFGSGTFSDVPTYLSQHMLVEPIALADEAQQLEGLGVHNPLRLLGVDERALLTTPVHVAANRAREDARGEARHGSCGKGIGETAAYALHNDAPTVGDCTDPRLLRAKLDRLAHHYAPLVGPSSHGHPPVDAMVALYTEFAAAVRIVGEGHLGALARTGRLVFEGAQGVLLDEWRGFHPHTTWSTVEPSNARAMLARIGARHFTLGVTRTYMTRHGAGPFPSEDPALNVLPEPHNGTGTYQGAFRRGHLDPVLLRYAITVAGVDALALTHLDAVDTAALSVVQRYLTPGGVCERVDVGPERDLGHQERLAGLLATAEPDVTPIDPARLVRTVEQHLGVPVLLTANGPDRAHRSHICAHSPAR